MNKWDKKSSVEGEWRQVETTEQPQDQAEETQLIVLEKEHERFYDKLRKKVEEFLKKQTGDKSDAAAQYILLAPDLFVLFARLLQDKRVPLKPKALAGVVVAYFISPIDLMPEALLGPIGFIDDIVLAAYALSRIMNEVDKHILLEHWNGEADLLETVQDVLKKAEDLVDNKVLGTLKNMLNKK
ncbi:YkvA family protein [Ammoniphilus sp. YIM 78166]|uniref:YkvA family protein n=1 Tax=Ammoniphilus sp. YIM 78166 TaxID=1644106 RepID=UPI0010701CAE|nr:YkvA family protein [Ammoniphilus sp. YIM 78166]